MKKRKMVMMMSMVMKLDKPMKKMAMVRMIMKP
jgi:hypothetical protein